MNYTEFTKVGATTRVAALNGDEVRGKPATPRHGVSVEYNESYEDIDDPCYAQRGFEDSDKRELGGDPDRAGYALIASRLPAAVRREALRRLSRGFGWSEVVELLKIGFPKVAERFSKANLRVARQELERWATHDGVNFTVFGEPEYPYLLSQSPDSPLLLYSKGGSFADFEDRPAVAIVGSRNCDFRGIEFATELACALANRGVWIVSGLAAGIDTAAHEGALRSNHPDRTVAVLGNGIKHTYPKANYRLAQQILESQGMLVSQFQPDVKPYPSQFLERNHVIAGLTHGVIVVQAANRSGSLVTARAALDLGRELFAVPGFPGDSRNSGTNRLLQDGAHLVINADDVLDILSSIGCQISDGALNQPEITTPLISPQAQQLYATLQRAGELNIYELSGDYDHATLPKLILELEMADLISQEIGGVIRLRSG